MASRDFQIQLAGYGLTTAEIHYRLPDHPSLLQLYLWQDYDLAPEFPILQRFLDHWRRELEGARERGRASLAVAKVDGRIGGGPRDVPGAPVPRRPRQQTGTGPPASGP